MLSLHHCWHLAKDLVDGYDGYGVGYGDGPKYGPEYGDGKLIGMYIFQNIITLVRLKLKKLICFYFVYCI